MGLRLAETLVARELNGTLYFEVRNNGALAEVRFRSML
jgi:hypothetical protein